MRLRSFVRAVVSAPVIAVAAAAPAFAQSPTPKATAKPGPPWTYYMAYATIGLAGVVLLVALAGYLLQSKGWQRDGAGPAGGRSG